MTKSGQDPATPPTHAGRTQPYADSTLPSSSADTAKEDASEEDQKKKIAWALELAFLDAMRHL
jgi:hypothetical protein